MAETKDGKKIVSVPAYTRKVNQPTSGLHPVGNTIGAVASTKN